MGEKALGLTHVTRAPRVGGDPHPGLLLLHGRGADEMDLLSLADALDPRRFVVSARAPGRLGPGYAWYELLGIGTPEPTTFERSVHLLTEFVTALPTAYPIDPTRLVVLGFSQGAVMSGSLLLTRPDLLQGTILLSGYLPLDSDLAVDESKLGGAPVFVAHGSADPLIPVAAGRQARDYLTRVGANVDYHEYPIAHYIGPEELQDIQSWMHGKLGEE